MKKKVFTIILILLNLLILNVSGTNLYSINSNFRINDEIIIRIIYDDNFFIPKNSDILGGCPGEFIDILINESKLEELLISNLTFSIIDQNYNKEKYEGTYHTLSEMEEILIDISLNYPEITRLFSIGLSYEGRNIWCLEISDNPGIDEDEPGVLFMGLHHAREWPTIEICLHIAEQLTSNYDILDNITNLINNRRVWIVACVNPDGYYFDYDLNNGIKMWRKNRHYFNEFDTYGVDLNRNYAGSCNGDIIGMWGSTGMSHSPDNNLFCGQNVFSEFETKYIKDLIIGNNICGVISFHTYGELVMWPWGYSKNVETPNDEYLSQIGEGIALRIVNQDQDGTYDPIQSAEFYPTTGDTCDWAYGYGHYVLGRQIFPFTIEACKSFHPDQEVLEQVCKENYEGALYLLEEAEKITNLTPRVMPPLISNVQFNENGDYLINWIEKNPEANVEYFQLDELEDFEMVFDDAENGNGLWDFNGFNISNDEFHSEEQSYKSHVLDNQVSSMTTNFPLPIYDNTSISFWCMYDIEDYYDIAFFEVSKDGRLYDVIDTYTGDSNGWIFKNYNLNEYDGESIYLRFRYSTDEKTHGIGFYFDDIFPIANFNELKIISNNIKDNSYEISNKPDGIYYYRIRGYNSEYGWGDYSIIKRIINHFEYNKPPSSPFIAGNINGKFGEEYQYTFNSYDPEGDDVYYLIDWGDGESEEWIGPYESGKLLYLNHTWNEKGDYTIRAKSRDIYNIESYWGTFEISMPINKFLKLIDKFVDINLLRFSILEKIINLF